MWMKIDDGFNSNPKVIDPDHGEPLNGDLQGLAAIGLWVLGGAYCAKHLTDGRISSRALAQLVDASNVDVAPLIARLVEVGLYDPQDTQGANGNRTTYQYHDWGDVNPLAEEVLATRQQRYEAAKRGGQVSAAKRAEKAANRPAEANGSTDRRNRAVQPGASTARPKRAAPTDAQPGGSTAPLNPQPIPTHPNPMVEPGGSTHGAGALRAAADAAHAPADTAATPPDTMPADAARAAIRDTLNRRRTPAARAAADRAAREAATPPVDGATLGEVPSASSGAPPAAAAESTAEVPRPLRRPKRGAVKPQAGKSTSDGAA